jgi:hypothetical protein
MCLRREREYDVSPRTPQASRNFGHAAVLAALHPSEWEAADDASLVVSELVSDSLTSAASFVRLTITLHFDHVEVTVEDDRPGGEVAMPNDLRQRIVQALTADVRAVRSPDGRAVVSARIAYSPEAASDIVCGLRPVAGPAGG